MHFKILLEPFVRLLGPISSTNCKFNSSEQTEYDRGRWIELSTTFIEKHQTTNNMSYAGPKAIYLTTCLLCGILCACSWAPVPKTRTLPHIIVGSTPGDESIKKQLGLPPETVIDFIRWNLQMNESNNFDLSIIYGENQPNTLGFKGGGQTRSYHGSYTLTKMEDIFCFHLVSDQMKITLAKINENLYHILTNDNQLMKGNGGWSYTLNSKNPTNNEKTLPTFTSTATLLRDNPIQVIYDGRTPCREFAAEHQWDVATSCFKLKWKLTLNRDSLTGAPTTYTIRKVVDNISQDVTGKWSIINGLKSNPTAVIYQLDPDKPDQTISLFVADENILFFLHKNLTFFVGNDDFSFTLNKRDEKTSP